MRLPNLLASRRGRLAAFFALYVTEGIPLGFAATAVATQLRRQGVGPAEIGAFVGSFYLPWAFKWAFGPFIDVFASDRLGRRRGWVLGTQVMMALTLLSLIFLDLPSQLALFTGILLVHNTFGAMQDVAIDGLAFRLETWAAGSGCVGPVPACDDVWVQQIFNALQQNWPSPSSDYIDVY